MNITIKTSASRARVWLWLLRARYKSKAGLPTLMARAVAEVIVMQAQKQSDEAYAEVVATLSKFEEEKNDNSNSI